MEKELDEDSSLPRDLSRGFFDSLNKSNPLNLLPRERFVRQLGDI
jgi:hypothetical protein